MSKNGVDNENSENSGERYLAVPILEKYELCERCLRRQIPTPAEVRYPKSRGNCYICGSLMSAIEEFSSKVIRTLAQYEFETFVLGTSLPVSFSEREDEVRARFKLKGGVSIKSEITRILRKAIAEKLGKKIRFRDYDLLVLGNPTTEVVEVIPASVLLLGRYTKNLRGIRQKTQRCYECLGEGCKVCDFAGVKGESVEKILEGKLTSLFNARSVRFSWFGGEDSRSLVLGKGRPFIAEVVDPKLRSLDLKLGSAKGEPVGLQELKVITNRPGKILEFSVKVLARIRFDSLRRERVRQAEKFFQENTVEYISSKKEKVLRKMVKDLRFNVLRTTSAEVRFTCDGGLHIKQFLTGEGGFARPSLSDVLGTKLSLDGDSPFDILDVEFKDETKELGV